MSHIQIAVDGPSGAGKSTVSRAIAKKYGIIYVDTGALYRTVGFYARAHGLKPDNIGPVTDMLPDIDIRVAYEDGVQCVYLNGENLGDRIRENEISRYASVVSALPPVRAFLLETQRRLARENSVIMDGRDIGTVILPDAQVKFFLTASPAARARRRVLELAQKGMPTDYDTVLADIMERDRRDRERDVAPAVAADDAVLFDNSELTFEQTLLGMSAIIENTLARKGIRI